MKPRMEKFFNCYLLSANVAKAARDAGIAPSTGYLYVKSPEFIEALSKQRKQSLQETTTYFQGKMMFCAETLFNIVESENTPPAVKIQAAQTIFNNVDKAINQLDILERLDALERLKQ